MRDDFSELVKRVVRDRAANRCSNPECKAVTSGPQVDPSKSVNVGVAAHISAASEGGPRYDPNLSPEERTAPDNCIWLCQNCAHLVDSDEARFTISLLKNWKRAAELDADKKIGKTHNELTAQQAKLALAGETTLVAQRLESFIREKGASWASNPSSSTAIIAIAMGWQRSHFPDEVLAELYVSQFGEELKGLLLRLRTAGAEFRHDDIFYVDPPKFLFAHTLQSILVELRGAAVKLATDGSTTQEK